MSKFEPFAAIRYATSANWDSVVAPPYDILSEDDITKLMANEYNIVWIDMPGGDEMRYQVAASRMLDWLKAGILVEEDEPAFYIYRMKMVDSMGKPRTISGVFGGLEVADKGGSVLPHERTTQKDSTDRLELTKATAANMSASWGLSLASGLTDALAEPGEPMGSVTIDGVEHILERVSDPARIKKIRSIVAADDVLLADGHHRYGVAREYRDMVREQTGSENTEAEYTLTFVNELTEDQLAIDAIHRVYTGVSNAELKEDLKACFRLEDYEGELTTASLQEMQDKGRLLLVNPDGSATWLIPIEGAFDGVRSLDGAWLEHTLAGSHAEVTYQHGLEEIKKKMFAKNPLGKPAGAILIRPTSMEEIKKTAREGVLMPPKSTYFSPKLLTGLVIRPTAALINE